MINTTNSTYDIIDRFIYVPVNTTTFAVQGDNASRVIIFRISRFIDGVDLSSKEIYVCFKTILGTTGETATNNIKYSNSVLEFSWAVPSEVTISEGTVEFYVEFREIDKENEKIYCLKTKPITQDIEKSFSIDNSATEGDFTIEKLFLDENSSHLTRTDLIDSDLPFKVDDRDILMKPTKVIAVFKDNMSQILSFRLRRKVDSIDRGNKTFCFKYMNANGESDICIASNVAIYEDEIYISWALDSKVTKFAGEVTFAIGVIGFLSDGTLYSWNTKPAQFTVEGGLDVESNLVKPVQSWFDSWVIEADNILKQSAQYANQAKDYYYNIDGMDKVIQDLAEKATEQATLARGYANEANNAVTEFNGLYAVRSEKDENNINIFKTVKYYRSDNTLFMISTLNTVIDTYDQRTEVRYDIDGVTLIDTKIHPIKRDIDGIVTGNFGHLGQLQYHGLI
ncbi:hypothetical protein KQI61_07945 [Anaerocolumna aminovalerica]|uniref:hypothetical protein n=1 Tax=Anaerocolumna aminovalerica TaxID=1527 RepID=UPI001C0EF9D6|nr:hypothetical protein [Anaerocolumna aminovalerica]MBU5332128.1 hypothetical protein [Anaerocolumna aminovalerica]